MKIVICEDERYWHDTLKISISRWAENRKEELQFSSFQAPKEMIRFLITHSDIDVVFLDISLGAETIDGMVAAKHIRKMGSRVPIIFVTVDLARAVDGYLVEAWGFLCKPVDEKRLTLFLDRLLKEKKNERMIGIMSETGIINVPQSNIVYAEVINHTIYYHTTKQVLHYRGSLTEVFETLGKDSFVQVHRSYVVAKSKIHRIKTTYPYSVDLVSGTEIINLPVSRNYKDKLIEEYSDGVLELMI